MTDLLTLSYPSRALFEGGLVDPKTRIRVMETLKQFEDGGPDAAVTDFATAFRLLQLNVSNSDPELAEAFDRAWLGISARALGGKKST